MKGDDPNAVRIVLSTHPDRQKALDLARRLVDERLAACVNVVDGATSIYRWEGKVCEEPEFLLIIKTAERCIGKLKHRIDELHPYEVPEVLVLPTDGGARKYLEWVAGETAP